ncbi:MAG: nuclear transport factor 2 family protein [Woeseiaceae bacterium]|nr:nuclear transport factor 2 family protein [Woeseiaceae bacterium]
MTQGAIAASGEHVRLDDLFAAIDAMDAERFAAFLTDDARFRFGSAPVVEGRDAIRAAVEQFFASIQGLRHHVSKVVESGNTLVCEGEVTYTRHDGTTIDLPFADVFETHADRIADYRIYMDINPLYAS